MKKTFKVLLIVLMLVVSIFKVNADNSIKQGHEGTKSDGSISRFELYDYFDKIEYFSGEEVIFYLGMSVSDSSESIMVLQLKLRYLKSLWQRVLLL